MPVRDYEDLIGEALALMPDLGLGTDIMVGFPGEDEQAFANTRQTAERLPFSLLSRVQLLNQTRNGRHATGGQIALT